MIASLEIDEDDVTGDTVGGIPPPMHGRAADVISQSPPLQPAWLSDRLLPLDVTPINMPDQWMDFFPVTNSVYRDDPPAQTSPQSDSFPALRSGSSQESIGRMQSFQQQKNQQDHQLTLHNESFDHHTLNASTNSPHIQSQEHGGGDMPRQGTPLFPMNIQFDSPHFLLEKRQLHPVQMPPKAHHSAMPTIAFEHAQVASTNCASTDENVPLAVLASDAPEHLCLKNTCESCSRSHVQCSGLPGPCKRCIRQNRADECRFLPKMRPGPRPRDRIRRPKRPSPANVSMSHGEVSHPLSLESPDEPFDFTKRVRVLSSPLPERLLAIPVDHEDNSRRPSNASSVFSGTSVGSAPESSAVQELISDLKSNHFMEPNLTTSSSFRNQAYFTKCVANAVEMWNSLSNSSILGLSCQQFVQTMLSYQQQRPECDYGLEADDLKKMYWLSGAGITVEDDVVGATDDESAIMVKQQLGLVFLWLGPATAQGHISPKRAIQRVYGYIHSTPENLASFEGFCSRHAAISKLSMMPRSESRFVLRLNEGRMEQVTTDSENAAAFANQVKNEYYMRNLVRSRFTEEAYSIPVGQPLPDDAVLHELLFHPNNCRALLANSSSKSAIARSFFKHSRSRYVGITDSFPELEEEKT